MLPVKTLLVAVSLFLFAPVTLAQAWSLDSAPANASVAKAAKVSNDSGDLLYLWISERAGDVALYGELQLAAGKTFSNKTPGYQIDQGFITKLNRIPLAPFKSKEGWLRITDKVATWKLFEGESKTIVREQPFYNWLVGNRIRFVYFNAAGQEKTTEFTLNGSSESIASATGVAIK